MKKGAIFDQDGLMFDTEAIYMEGWIAVAEELGIVIPEGYFAGVRGASGENLIKAVNRFLPDVDAKDYIDRVFDYAHTAQDTRLPEKPGLHEILSFFKSNGVKMAVASSTKRSRVEKNLKKSGIDQYFEVLVTGDEVTEGKPDPEIFLTAAAKIGLDPTDCYVFEDSYNGVRAGHRAGCCTVMVPDLIGPDEEMLQTADLCCKDLLEVVDSIKTGKI
ncbi:MAG: HAD family phosphatase [Clostridiales bacterium]|nr:HAD family phosphatase [Candidatus Blautia equi]